MRFGLQQAFVQSATNQQAALRINLYDQQYYIVRRSTHIVERRRERYIRYACGYD